MTKKEKLEKILKKTMTQDEFDAYSVEKLSKDIEKSKLSFSEYIKQIDRSFELADESISKIENSISESFEHIEREIESKISLSSQKGTEILESTKNRLFDEIKSSESELRKVITSEISLTKKEIDVIIKKIQKDIEDLFWYRTLNGSNNVQAVLNVKSSGSLVANNVTGINFIGATVTTDNNGGVTVAITGGSGTWYQDEVPGGVKNGSNVTFTLAHTPSSVVLLYLNGQYQVSGGADYSRSGTTITMTSAPLSTDTLTCNYS